MKVRECPNCRALLVQASTVCGTCGLHVGSTGLPPPAVPRPPWLDEGAGPGADPEAGSAAAADAGPFAASGPPAPGAPAPPGGWVPFDAAAGGAAPPPPPPGASAAPGWGAGATGPFGGPPTGPLGYAPRQTHPQATTAMVLGILSLVVCGVLAIPAIVIGNRVQREIRASGGRLDGESSARAGVICGWVSVALTAIGVVAFVALVMIGSAAEPTYEYQPVPVTIDPGFEVPPIDEFGPTSTTR